MIKSIKKARKNGWDKFDHYNKFEMHGDKMVKFISDDKCEMTKGIAYVPIEAIIFDIDFAKARWGKEIVCSGCGNRLKENGCVGSEATGKHHLYTTIAYQYHLKKISLEDNRIAYLKIYEI